MTSNRINIEFTIQSTPYLLTVCDMSQWAFIVNEPAIVEITPPGYSGKITKYFDKGKNNVFNSTLLDLTCEDGNGDSNNVTLSDGIYKVKVIGSPDTFSKEHHYLKTDLFEMELSKVFIDNHRKRRTEAFNDQLTQIEFLLRSARAHIEFGDITTAGTDFELAQSLLEDLKGCTTCN